MRSGLARVYQRLLEACGLLAGIALGVLAVLISIDIVVRNLGIAHLAWLLETSEYTLYVATFVAAPWVLHQGAHVRVDLLLNVVPARVGLALELLADALGALVGGVLLVFGARATLDAYALDSMIIKQLVVPEWCLLAVIPASASLLMVEFVIRLRRVLWGEPPARRAAVPRNGL